MAPDFSRYERIVATRSDRILTLTLTAPNPVNAVDGEMHHELSRIFLDAQDDTTSDLIVLTGAGRAFCAGGDTAWFKTHIENPASFRALGPEAKRIITSLLDLEKPIPALWPQFEALASVPVLAIRGENSDLLSQETLAEMGRRHPNFAALTVPGQGRVTAVAIGGKDKDTLYAFCGNKIWKRKIQQHALGAWSPWTKVMPTKL
jgi:pimeloyl-ACP methyl ester carboxylesterase